MDEVVLYICNRQKCGEKCGDHCEHTADIEYARNFKIAHEDGNKRIWVEIDAQPEIIRCKDCKWYDSTHPYGTVIADAFHCKVNDRFYKDSHFCGYGERRESDG